MASHMGTSKKPASKSPHGIIVVIVGCLLVVGGIVLIVLSLAPDPTIDGRPQERIRAKLAYTNHERNSHYDSGYKWWGTYECSYQKSSGYVEGIKGYESEAEVPKHRTVRIYLGQDDVWHVIDRNEAGNLFVGGIALVAVGIASGVLGVLMRKAGVGFHQLASGSKGS